MYKSFITHNSALIIIALSLSFTLSAFGQTVNKEYFIDSTGKDTLKPFKVVFMTGDEVVRKYEITVYDKNNKLYASGTLSPHYYSYRNDSIVEIKLNSKQAAACFNFLNKAKSLPNDCPNLSSSVKNYRITLGNKTIRINGGCDWAGFDYYYLESHLFDSTIKQ